MSPTDIICEQAFKDGIKPTEKLPVDKWADKYRRLSRKAGAKEPGPYRTSRMPYLREIMFELSPESSSQHISAIKATQLGFTDAGINWFGHTVHIDQAPMMMLLPTIDVAKRHSKIKLAPVIEETPVLDALIQKPRERDSGNTTLMKEFPGGVLIVAGANSAASLRNVSIKKLMLDEIDAYEADLESEGDTCSIAEKRTDAFGDERKIYKLSTPTIKGISKIEKEFEDSDQRHYYVPCPHCTEGQVLNWDGLKFQHEGFKLIGGVVYRCRHCGKDIPEHHKSWMLENGQWRAHNPGHRHRGYKISSLYSPLGFLSWIDIVEEWLKAKRDNNIEALKTWTNTRLAEPWDDSLAASIGADALINRREDYGLVVPWQALVLIASVDTQPDRLECTVKAWSPSEESWAMEHRVFWGNTSEKMVWNDLDEYLKAPWLHASGAVMNISLTTIDSGGHNSQEVYDFVRPRERRRIFAIKGSQFPGRPIIDSRGSRKNKGNVTHFMVGTDTAKDTIYGRLALKSEPRTEADFYKPLIDTPLEITPGRMHWNMDFDEEYFNQLTGETTEPPPKKTKRGIRSKPRLRYVQRRERVEALDCEVYNLAGLKLIMGKNPAAFWRKMLNRVVAAAKKAKETPVQEVPAADHIANVGKKVEDQVAAAGKPIPGAARTLIQQQPIPSVHRGRRIISRGVQ